MKEHAYIYSYEGMTAGIVGWILQGSPSYKTNYFKFFQNHINQEDGSIIDGHPEFEEHSDPWDNHSEDDDHWSHKYIENLEVDNDDFSWFDNFVNTFPGRGIFGLSYGSYQKTSIWNNPNVNIIFSRGSTPENIKRYKDLFIYTYWKRTFDLEQMIESIDMHTHDHHADCSTYKFKLMFRLGNAEKYARQNKLEFWQLQMLYHHDYDELPDQTPEEYEKLYKLYDEEVGNSESRFHLDPNVIKVDIFDLDLKQTCAELEIEYVAEMEDRYEWFKKFCREFNI